MRTETKKSAVFRAGVIPYLIEGGKIKMLFMKPSDPRYGGDTFQIAKGKIDENEDDKTAALREGKEELGLFSGNIIETIPLGNFLGRMSVYVVKVLDKDLFGDPHFETKETRWMSEGEFLREGRELHRHVIKAAIRAIKQRERIR